MKMKRMVAVLGCSGLVLFSTTGCHRFITKTELMDRIVEANSRVETVHLEGDVLITITTEMGDSSESREIPFSMSGAIDMVNKRMQMEIGLFALGAGGKSTTVMYGIGDTVYARTNVPDVLEFWIKTDMPQGSWDTQNQAYMMFKMVDDSEVHSVTTDWIEGKRCYRVELSPDFETMMRMLSQQMGFDRIMGAVLSVVSFEDAHSTFWIAKGTYLPIKSEGVVTMFPNVTDPLEDEEKAQTKIRIESQSIFWDYNEPVSIELPDEATGAPYVPTPPLPDLEIPEIEPSM